MCRNVALFEYSFEGDIAWIMKPLNNVCDHSQRWSAVVIMHRGREVMMVPMAQDGQDPRTG